MADEPDAVQKNRRTRAGVPSTKVHKNELSDSNYRPEEEEEDDENWIESLKRLWGRLLDNIEDVLTRGGTKASPKGKLDTDEVMKLWGKVTWPLIFLTRLKSKSASPGGSLPATDMSILTRSIQCAVDSEPELADELRTHIGLAEVYADLLSSVEDNKKRATSFGFDKAIASLASAVKDMQDRTGIYFEDTFMQPFTSFPVLAHLSTHASNDDTESPQHEHANPFCVDGVTFHASSTPSDLVVVSLRPLTSRDQTMDNVYRESSASLRCPPLESVPNIAKGVIFSDAENGVACLATSVLSDLGVEFDDVGLRLILKNTSAFFDTAFLGSSDECNSDENESTPRRTLPWDAAPDIDLGLEW